MDTRARFEDAVNTSDNYDGICFEFNNNGILGVDLDFGDLKQIPEVTCSI